MAQRILIVDDEAEIVEYLQMVLDDHGFETKGVNSPLEAIKIAETETFDAIISDMKMPKMTGLEMISHIRSGTANMRTPIIVLSGALTDDNMIKLQRLGIIDVMSKPPEVDILVRIIQKAARLKPAKSGNGYNDKIIKAFDKSFNQVMKGHLADHVTVSPAVASDSLITGIEYSGMVSLFGRRLSGVLTVSYQTGFTLEFAKALLGSVTSPKELEIFESTVGEIAEQIAIQAAPILQECGLHIMSSAPKITMGRHAVIPLPPSQPHMVATATVAGKHCYLEYALLDLNSVFAGRADLQDVKILG